MRERRISALFCLTSAIFSILLIRITALQLMNVQKYKRLARENYVKPQVVESPRGIIYSRDRKVLAENIPSYTIIIDSNRITEEEHKEFSSFLKLHSHPDSVPLQTDCLCHYVINKVPFSIICEVEEHKEDFPNVSIIARPTRTYPNYEIFSHLLGYTSEISKKELKAYSGYRLGTTIGKSGIEKGYEEFLRGKDGTKYIEVDVRGRELELISYVSPEPGCDIWLNIDAELQIFAYEILPDRGACVAMNPQSGEILLWVSKPGFDPNLFSGGIPSEIWREWREDSLSPLWDRVMKGCFPPASVFKLVTAAAGLEKGIVGPHTKQPVQCNGSMMIGRREFKCWETHGSLNLIDAIVYSCDVYFYQLGILLGVETMMNQAKKVGLGERIGVDIPGEPTGLIPSEKWYDKRYGKGRWSKGISANLSVGQGEILTSPLQILYFVSGIANRKVLNTPRIVARAVNPDGEEVFSNTPHSRALPWSDETIEVLRQGMLGVVERLDGTGGLARVPGIRVAGKTGTAQNPGGEHHAWFVAFAPYYKPEICVVVFVENGGMGGSVAAPIAGQILRKFFHKDVYTLSN